MTDTNCPSCKVLLDLSKYATGHCEWCGCELPDDQVRHARERVAQKSFTRQKKQESTIDRASDEPPANRGLTVAYFIGICAVLGLIGLFAINGVREGRHNFDLTMAALCIVALAFAGIAISRQWSPRRASRTIR